MGYSYVTQYKIKVNGELKNNIIFECGKTTYCGVEKDSAIRILRESKDNVIVRLNSCTCKPIYDVVNEWYEKDGILFINTKNKEVL